MTTEHRVFPEPDEDGRLLYNPEQLRVGDRIRIHLASLAATSAGDVVTPIPIYAVGTVQRVWRSEGHWCIRWGDDPKELEIVSSASQVEILPSPAEVAWAIGNGSSMEADRIWTARYLAGEAEERRQALLEPLRASWR